jgi:NAD(P)-dependent dehydrogenase (short-subunit alcohol dehydrogenase family)
MPPPQTPALFTAVVVDGGVGAGRIVTSRLAAQGAQVAVAAVTDPIGASYLCKELSELGLSALPFQVDPADLASVARLVSDVVQLLGRIDVFVNLIAVRSRTEPSLALTRHVLAEMNRTGNGGRVIVLADPAVGEPWSHGRTFADTASVEVVPVGTPAVGADTGEQQRASAVLRLLGFPLAAPRPAGA